MAEALELHEDRLFSPDPSRRKIARQLYEGIRDLPIISPHGHTDPAWFANNECFTDAYSVLVEPDHYLLRMLFSQGISMADLGFSSGGGDTAARPRDAWRHFSKCQHLFRGTPSGLWLDHVFKDIFGLSVRLDESTADDYFDRITELLGQDQFRPRQIVDRFNIDFLATTESAIAPLPHHRHLRESDWNGRVVSTYRPDSVVDAEHPDFNDTLRQFGELTGEDVYTWKGYLRAHRKRRADFIALGATATDHGHPTPGTGDLVESDCRKLFARISSGQSSTEDAELFRGQLLTEMAKMSLDDGLVMQIHPGVCRNHNSWLFDHYGSDKGADIPVAAEYTHSLRPLLNQFGNDPRLTVIVFTLDESTYARELAPLAGHYPSLLLGPPWWFNDSPQGILRFRDQTTETAGFYNTAGFNDDTRALFSIPARHDMSRRVDCRFLAQLVAEHRLSENDAHTIANDLTSTLPRRAYRLDERHS